MAKKSLLIAYVLWFFGGAFGLHHIYLRRDRQAFLYWMTFGGYMGLGWLYDAFMMKTYVSDANEDKDYMEKLAKEMRRKPKPVISSFRYMIQATAGDFFGNLVAMAIPYELVQEWHMLLTKLFVPLGVALGVHLVGNIGRHKGKLIYPLIGAYVALPLSLLGYYSIMMSTLFSIGCHDRFGKEWRRTPPKKQSVARRTLVLSTWALLYLGLWGSFLYFNCEIVTSDDQTVKCRDAVKHFFTSPLWQDIKQVLKDIREFARHHGWRELWHHILESFDPQGKANALKVLGLDEKATEQEISARYRKLSRQWHPDKHKDPTAKEEAQAKFIEIQSAYEILSTIKAQRAAQNVKETS